MSHIRLLTVGSLDETYCQHRHENLTLSVVALYWNCYVAGGP